MQLPDDVIAQVERRLDVVLDHSAPRTRTNTGRPLTPAVAKAWTRKDAVTLWRVLDAAYQSEQPVSEVRS